MVRKLRSEELTERSLRRKRVVLRIAKLWAVVTLVVSTALAFVSFDAWFASLFCLGFPAILFYGAFCIDDKGKNYTDTLAEKVAEDNENAARRANQQRARPKDQI